MKSTGSASAGPLVNILTFKRLVSTIDELIPGNNGSSAIVPPLSLI
jgi:hypothetical protein